MSRCASDVKRSFGFDFAFFAIWSSCVDILLLPLSMCRECFPAPATQPAPLLPHVRGFPALRVLPASPTSTVASVSLRLVRSVDILGPLFPGRDGGGSPRCHDASISARAVLLDPAGVSRDHRLCGRLLMPSRFSTLSASGCVTRLNRFTCVTAWTSLGLRLTHVVTFMSPRLDSRWAARPFPGREFHPLEAPGLAWRTEIA